MIGPIDGSNQLPVNRIPVRHAVDYLRQHYAVEKGVDNMGHFHIGSSSQSAGEAERASCAQIHQSAQERALAEIGGCLSGAKIPVWKETPQGELVLCGGQWAWKQVEQETIQADTLYFVTSDWNLLLPNLTSEVSRNHFESAIDGVLEILCGESAGIWEKERDHINSEFSKAGRVQSTYHVKALSEAAGMVATGLLDRAFEVAAPLIDYAKVKEFASSVFEPLATDITEIAVGQSGRSPCAPNVETAARLTDEARQRIGNKIALWRLQAQIKNGGLPTPPKVNGATIKKPVGRPKGAGAIDDSPHLKEMARLMADDSGVSVRAAAKALEPKAIQPNSTGESTVRRLVGKFNEADVAK